MSYTETLRRRLRAKVKICPTCGQATREGGLREAADAIGIGHTTLWRFLHGRDITGRNIDLIEAWLAPTDSEGVEP